MKIKFLTATFLLTVISFSAFSQKLSVGIKAGSDIQKIKGKSFDEEYKAGYHVGAFAEIKIKKIGIQPEIYFSQVNATQGTDVNSFFNARNISKAKLSYLNIPILANIYFNKSVAFQVGPQFGVLLNQDITKNGNLGNGINDAFKKGDFSIAGGLQFKLLMFRIYGRYVIGLNDKSGDIVDANNNPEKWKSQTIHVGLSYSFL